MDDEMITSHTVHLVTKQPEVPAREGQNEGTGLRHRVTNNVTTASESRPAQPSRNDQANMAFDANAWAAALQQYTTATTHHSTSQDQAYWMQQMYSQYMNQYMQYLQQVSNTAPNGVPVVQQQQLFTPPLFNQPPPQPAPAPGPVVGPAQAPGPIQNEAAPVMNAGGALGGLMQDDDDEEAGGQRDWLDWFYVSSRLLVLFSVVFFYSTLGRFLLVTLLGLIAYLWNVGFLRRRAPVPPAAPQPPQEERDRQQPQAEDRADEEDAQEQDTDQGEEEEEEQQDAAGVPQRQNNNRLVPPPSPWDTTVTFVTTFFSSLLPEQPQAV